MRIGNIWKKIFSKKKGRWSPIQVVAASWRKKKLGWSFTVNLRLEQVDEQIEGTKFHFSAAWFSRPRVELGRRDECRNGGGHAFARRRHYSGRRIRRTLLFSYGHSSPRLDSILESEVTKLLLTDNFLWKILNKQETIHPSKNTHVRRKTVNE